MRAQSSTNTASMMIFSTVLVWAESLRRSKTEPSERYLTYTPRSRSFTVWSNTCEKSKLNKTRASKQPCVTPLEMLKKLVQSPIQITWPVNVVEEPYQHSELAWAAQLSWDGPQSFSVDCAKSLGQGYEHWLQIHLLFNTLLFDLTHSKHYVYGIAAMAEATLVFRQVTLTDVGHEPFEEDVGQDFSGNGKQGHAPVISAIWFRFCRA